MKRTLLAAAALAALLVAATAAAQGDLDVVARLAPEELGIDQMTRFTIEVRGDGVGSRQFEPEFELDNLEVEAGPSSSQSFSFVNGVASRSQSLSWILRPKGVGTARVHSIRVRIGDAIYEPADTVATVREDAVGRAQPPQRRRDPIEDFFPPLGGRVRRGATQRPEVFLRAEISPREPWVGQQALYTLYLYTQAHVSSINPESLPDFNGFWVQELELQDQEVEMVDVDGRRFGRVPILRRAVFPLRAGDLKLEPAKVQLSVRIPDRTFGSMFSDVEPIRRDSNALTLTARELPAGAPAGYSGAVGELQVAAQLEPAGVTLGEASTFSVTLSGAGHLQGLPAPDLPEFEGLRIFPPQQESDERIVGHRVRGRRTWRYVLVPELAHDYELPAIEVPYFDPRSGSYEIARAEPVRLAVSPSPAAADAQPAVASAGEALPEATVPTGFAAALPTIASASWAQILPWVLVTLLAATLSIVLLRRRPRTAPAGRTADLASALRDAAGEGSPRRAAARIEEGWRTLLESRWGVPPGVASQQWTRHLEGRGIPAATVEELVALADDIHYLRYAPQLADTDALKGELILRSQKLSRSLQ